MTIATLARPGRAPPPNAILLVTRRKFMATDIIIPLLLFLSHIIVFVLGFSLGRHVERR